MPPLPKLLRQGGAGQSCFTVTDLPAFLSPLTHPATPIGEVPQMSHSVSRGLSALTYPRVFSKPDPPQSEKTQPEGTGLQGLCAKPSQESRPGVPQARPAEGASPQKKRRCLPGTEFPWSPALSPSFTRTASRGTHLQRARLALGPDRLPPLTVPGPFASSVQALPFPPSAEEEEFLPMFCPGPLGGEWAGRV